MKFYAVLMVRLLLALAFTGAAYAKLSGNPMMVASFAKIGLGQWFRYLTGALELVAAVGLLPNLTAGPAAVLLVCVMTGAVLAHLVVLGGSFAPALVLGLMSALVVWERGPAFLSRLNP